VIAFGRGAGALARSNPLHHAPKNRSGWALLSATSWLSETFGPQTESSFYTSCLASPSTTFTSIFFFPR
jgi:hypothetical protein